MIAGICPHGIMLAGLDDSVADEEDKRNFAATYRCERREVLKFEGHCEVCSEQYHANCELMEVEP